MTDILIVDDEKRMGALLREEPHGQQRRDEGRDLF